jgi:predicted transcriptional regulator
MKNKLFIFIILYFLCNIITFILFLSAAKKVEQNKAKTLASMGLKTHFARVAIIYYDKFQLYSK